MKPNLSTNDFLAFVAGILGVPANTLSLNTAYGSLPQWDSLAHLRLTLELEAKYGFEVPADEIAGIRTLGDFHRRALHLPDTIAR